LGVCVQGFAYEKFVSDADYFYKLIHENT